MQLDRIYAGEYVSISIDLDTSDTDPSYTLTGDVTFRIGAPGGDALVVADAAYADTSGVVSIALDPLPDLPAGEYPWQLVAETGAVLLDGTVEVARIIAGTESTAPEVSVTVGTDSYLSVDDADALLLNRLGADDWRMADADTRARALVTATSAIDALMLVGSRVYASQALAFPRYIPERGRAYYIDPRYDGIIETQTTVPDRVLLACALEASALISDDGHRRKALQAQGVRSVSSPSGGETYGGPVTGIMSPDAHALLREWVMGWGPVS